MAHSLILSVCALVLFLMYVSAQTVILGDSVNLTASCAAGEISGVNSELVAKLVDDQWEPEENYKQRIEHLSTSAVRLKNVNINDRFFHFDCSEYPIQLTVVVPCELSVYEGEAASLMCHVPTAAVSVKRITWEVNGTLVLELNCSTVLSVFKEFEGRVSVPDDRCTTGNMTLTVRQVKVTDHGVFVCYVEDKTGKNIREYSGAVRMKVQKRSPEPITPSSPPSADKPEQTGTSPTVITLSVLLAFAIATCLVFGTMLCKDVRPCRAAEGNEGRHGNFWARFWRNDYQRPAAAAEQRN